MRSTFSGEILTRIEEAVDGLGESAVERPDAGEWDFDEPVLTGLFHQLSASVCWINIHDHIQTLCAGDAYYLTELRGTTENMIRLNDDSRNGGTHWTPQHVSDFRREMNRATILRTQQQMRRSREQVGY